MDIWKVLGIAPTKDEEAIREAYLEKLSTCHPEEEPEDFQRLRAAYERATHDIEDHRIEAPVEAWLLRVEETYKDFDKRIRRANWETLLEEKICFQLDSSKEVGEGLLIFLMDHYKLPHDIWQLLDTHFNWILNKEELEERFSRGFMAFVISSIKYESRLDYHYFLPIAKDKDYDTWIDLYYKANKALNEGQLEQATCYLEDMKALEICHPEQEMIDLEIAMKMQDEVGVEQVIDRLLQTYPGHMNSCYLIGEWKLRKGLFEEAEGFFKQILRVHPTYKSAQIGLANCKLGQKRYEQAEVIYKILLEENPYEVYVRVQYEKVREDFVRYYKKKWQTSGDEKFRFKLLYLYYEAGNLEACHALLSQFKTEENSPYLAEYMHMRSKIAYEEGRGKAALAYLENWKRLGGNFELIQEEMGMIHQQSQAYEKALVCYNKALETKKNDIGLKSKLGAVFNRLERYDEAIMICTEGLRAKPEAVPLLINRGEAYFNKGDYKEALADCEESIRLYPYYVTPYITKLKLFYNLGHLEVGMQVIEQLKVLKLENEETNYYKAQFLEGLGKEKEARAIYLALIKENEVCEKAYYELARLYGKIEDYDQALTCINKAISSAAILRSKEVGRNYFLRALIYTRQKLYDKARADYDMVIRLNYEVTRAYYNKGALYEEEEQLEEAMSCYEKAVALGDHKANYHLGEIYYKQQNYEKAMVYYTHQLGEEMSDYCYTARAWCYLKLGEIEKAKADFEDALSLNQTDAYIYNGLGITYAEEGSFEESVACFKEALARDKKCLLVYINITTSLSKLGEYKEAAHYYTQAIALAPEEVNLYIGRGRMYEKLNQYEKAIEDFEHVLEMNVAHPFIYGDIGRVYRRMGEYREAVECLKLAVYTMPTNEMAQNDLAHALIDELEDYEEAITFYSKKIITAQNAAVYYKNRALAYSLSGNKIKARLDYKKALRFFLMGHEHLTEAERAHHRGDCYLGLNKISRAIACYEEAISQSQAARTYSIEAYHNSFYKLGKIFEMCEAQDKAFLCYEKAYHLQPYNKWYKSAMEQTKKAR